MSEVIKLSEATQNLPKLENEIRKGGVIVIPIEGSYVYLADAFNYSAVKRIHELRGDPEGTAYSVAIGSEATLNGICANVTEEVKKLIKEFWPGPLTLFLQPNSALNWNLGDNRELGEFAVSMPKSELLKNLANNIGPLALASAAIAGQGAAPKLENVGAFLGEINLYVDGGDLPETQSSTVVRSKVIGLNELEIVRLGAISLQQLQNILPEITLGEHL